ncbi:cell filamentation protein Fic [candidate division WOR_3 bacterium SM23_60]|uniref:Cell filamentation protein Fic n=1 Tax=candidate division WOR_3 bacterium SM23_60 TaxID=1703780 RepID=A0A0S8GIK4_UNCW3|nr:MAG: cell filamentation protein Fic [candidate division WOR_3 bacterium SM23_60]
MENALSERAGVFVQQPGGFKAFIPKPLPPDPAIRYDDELQALLSKADRAIARLDGIVTVLPNPELFIAMYVKKEALLSSQIEGTEASLEGVLEFEADMKPRDDIKQVKEVVNYIKALEYGIKHIRAARANAQLFREIHRVLIHGTRGSKKALGEFRRTQNWIGPAGANVFEAHFVPPPPDQILRGMANLEEFFNRENSMPPLVKAALIHAQFETIHPFVDGNGRIGRLLITFFLIAHRILERPLLYLSYFLKRNRTDYYDLLMNVRLNGDWESWVKFFLKGIHEVSLEAGETAGLMIKLKQDMIDRLYTNHFSSIYAVKLIDVLFAKPIIDVKAITEEFKISKESGNEIVKRFEQLGILRELTGKQRYKKYLFHEYTTIISRGTH